VGLAEGITGEFDRYVEEVFVFFFRLIRLCGCVFGFMPVGSGLWVEPVG
jgi:hypothetical protein